MPKPDILDFDFDSSPRPASSVKEEAPKPKITTRKTRKKHEFSEHKKKPAEEAMAADTLEPNGPPEEAPPEDALANFAWNDLDEFHGSPSLAPMVHMSAQAPTKMPTELTMPEEIDEPADMVIEVPSKLPTNETAPTAPVSAGGKVRHDKSVWPGNTSPRQSPPNRNDDGILSPASPLVSPLQGETIHGGFGGASPSTSPRSAFRLPVRKVNGYQSFGDYHVSSTSSRPAPMLPHLGHAPLLPHHPQAHYYGVRDTDLGLPSRSTSRQSAADDYLAFDSLECGPEELGASGNIIFFRGSENSLAIYRLDRNRSHHLGQLEGLRGKVIAAKMIPRASRNDALEAYRPLLALIIHGSAIVPMEPERSFSQPQDEFEATASTMIAMSSVDPAYVTSSTLYQTTVEVYSLAEQRHIATLFSSPVAKAEPSLGPQSTVAPAPLGNLSIDAKGRFVIVTSGISGEVYIFEASRNLSASSPEPFSCIGKTWTSMPNRKARSWSSSSSSSEPEASHDASPARSALLVEGTVSLSTRWLAIIPPLPQSHTTFYGRISLPPHAKPPPGLASHTAASQPAIITEIDAPFEESLLNRVARDVTQEVIKGARWVGDQGLHAWKTYWAKPTDPPSPYDVPAPPLFPPTHAHDERNRVSHQPTLISIIDLERLSQNQDAKGGNALQPMATFSLSGGCSFLSFGPNGLSLLTASAKGDVQQVWDLMRMVHGATGMAPGRDAADSETASMVRQVARFTRVTVANIVDVVWSDPNGEKVGVVTDRGTVHVFDLPPSAFQWPPLRRPGKRAVPKPEDTNASSGAAAATGAFTSAMNIVSGSTQPLLAAVRGRPPSMGSAISGLGGFGLTAGAGVKGGKLVASGFSKSVEAASGTVNTIRHMSDNKLAIPRSGIQLRRGCVRWISTKDRSQLVVVGGGMVRVHDVQLASRPDAGRNRGSVVGSKATDVAIPSSQSDRSQADGVEGLSPHRVATTTNVNATAVTPIIQWPRPPPPPAHPRKVSTAAYDHPLSFAEIETSAPYQPFHTDRRINSNLYVDADESLHFRHTVPWVFGADMPVVRISAGADDASDGDVALASGDQLTGSEGGMRKDDGAVLLGSGGGGGGLTTDETTGQQVVVTTRRKRGKKSGRNVNASGEEFFEDDLDIVEFAHERV